MMTIKNKIKIDNDEEEKWINKIFFNGRLQHAWKHKGSHTHTHVNVSSFIYKKERGYKKPKKNYQAGKIRTRLKREKKTVKKYFKKTYRDAQ